MELQEALSSRPEVLATFAASGESPRSFNWISEKYAGDKTDCGHAPPAFGCCQHGNYVSYFELAHLLHTLIKGDVALEDVFLIRTIVEPSIPKLAIIQLTLDDISVTFRGIHFLRSLEGPPPTVLQVVLNHAEYRAKTPTQDAQEMKEGNWDYHPILQLMHGLECRMVFYDVFAVVYSDDHHYNALIIDESGQKWTYDSLGPVGKAGQLLYHDNTSLGLDDKHIFGDTYSARMVYYTKRLAMESVPLESDVVDLTEDTAHECGSNSVNRQSNSVLNDNAGDADSDHLGSPS